MSKMVELVARAICKSRFLNGGDDSDDGWDSATPQIQKNYLSDARAALAAMREPTQTMCTAGYFDAQHSIEPIGELAPPPEEQPKLIFQAMIDEALKS